MIVIGIGEIYKTPRHLYQVGTMTMIESCGYHGEYTFMSLLVYLFISQMCSFLTPRCTLLSHDRRCSRAFNAGCFPHWRWWLRWTQWSEKPGLGLWWWDPRHHYDRVQISKRRGSMQSNVNLVWPGLSCGHLSRHLRDCGVDMENAILAVDTQVVDAYIKMALLTSVK